MHSSGIQSTSKKGCSVEVTGYSYLLVVAKASDASLESLEGDPISGELLARATSMLLQSSLSSLKMKGIPPPQ